MSLLRATRYATRLALAPLFLLTALLLTANAQQIVSVSFNAYPTTCSVEDAIAAGPGGALWFPLYSRGIATVSCGIWQITTSGVSMDVGGPGGDQVPTSAITAGPDGALWFTYGS